MLNNKMCQALNSQITAEFYSSYLYMQMGSWFDSKGLSGFAHWMKLQAQEEAAHTEILYNYIIERGAPAEYGAIEKPRNEFKSPLEVFEAVLKHEETVTGLINSLMALAIELNDFATKARLEWFVMEQVEEESGVGDVVNKLRLIGDDTNGLFILDKDLSTRTFNVPSPLGKA
jgi:ferritin